MGTHVGTIDTPVDGDVPVWVVDHWELQPFPVTTGEGISGDGTPASPLALATPMAWGTSVPTLPDLDAYGTDSTVGQPVYVDSAGKVRAQPTVIPGGTGYTNATLPEKYPVGVSLLSIPTNTALPDGFPIGGNGAVHTVRRVGDTADNTTAAWQWCYRATSSGASQEVFFRAGANTTWGPWINMKADVALPVPVDKYHSADQTITSTTRGTETPTQVRATVTNPHATKRMLVHCVQNCWIDLEPGDGGAYYLDSKITSGGTLAVPAVAARRDNVTAGNAVYDAARADMWVWVAAKAVLTTHVACTKSQSGLGMVIRYLHNSLVPLRYE